MLHIHNYIKNELGVQYFFGDDKGPVGHVWCMLHKGRAHVDCNVTEVTPRCVKAIKLAMREFLLPIVKSFGYTEAFCETTHVKLVSIVTDGLAEVVTVNPENNKPIYRMDI